MQTISVRQANQNFSHYLSLVDQGQEFVIAKRGRPVAQLVMPAAVIPESAHSEKLQQAQAWLDQFKFESVRGPFTEEDIYD